MQSDRHFFALHLGLPAILLVDLAAIVPGARWCRKRSPRYKMASFCNLQPTITDRLLSKGRASSWHSFFYCKELGWFCKIVRACWHEKYILCCSVLQGHQRRCCVQWGKEDGSFCPSWFDWWLMVTSSHFVSVDIPPNCPGVNKFKKLPQNAC